MNPTSANSYQRGYGEDSYVRRSAQWENKQDDIELAVDRYFASYDINQDQVLDRDECKMLLSELKSQNLDSHNFKNVNFDNFDQIFDQIDGNKDGSLSKQELHNWLIQMCSTGTTTVHLEHEPVN